MNTLNITSANGLKFGLNTFRFLQDSLREGINVIGQGMGDCVLAGAVVTDTAPNYNIALGSAIVDGEPCIVPAHNIAKNGSHQFWLAVEESTDAAGNVATKKTGTTVETFKVRVAKLTSGASAPAGAVVLNTTTLTIPTLSDRIKIMAGSTLGAWVNMTYSTGFTNHVNNYLSIPAINNLRYRSSSNGRLLLQGFCDGVNNAGSVNVVAVLPIGKRPSAAQSFNCWYMNEAGGGGTWVPISITVQANGNIEVTPPNHGVFNIDIEVQL